MSKPSEQHREASLPEYDFSKGVRGKYLRGSKLRVHVLLDPDVAKVFTSSQAVNEALRGLASLARKQARKRSR